MTFVDALDAPAITWAMKGSSDTRHDVDVV
jgi:hypothetical protein